MRADSYSGKLLDQRVALITGANGGIGHAVLQGFLISGGRCIATDIGSPVAEIEALISDFPTQLCFESCDLVDTDQRSELIEFARRKFAPVDVLFNNAAIFDMAPLLESDEAMYDRLFNINVKAMFFLMQGIAAAMIEEGCNGSIINMASQAGRRGEALVSHYCATKAAVISYTQSAALALAAKGIRVNAISPGVVDTPMWDTVDGLFARYESLQKGEKKKQVGEAVPLGRMGQPRDLVGTAVFLASEMSEYITGQTINVDGGNVLS